MSDWYPGGAEWDEFEKTKKYNTRSLDTDQLIDAVREWGRSRQINNVDKQALKLLEECGELANELCRGRYQSDEVEDALGDIEVVLIILADILGYDLRYCLESAYNVIKDRKGHTVNGSFVKES